MPALSLKTFDDPVDLASFDRALHTMTNSFILFVAVHPVAWASCPEVTTIANFFGGIEAMCHFVVFRLPATGNSPAFIRIALRPIIENLRLTLRFSYFFHSHIEVALSWPQWDHYFKDFYADSLTRKKLAETHFPRLHGFYGLCLSA